MFYIYILHSEKDNKNYVGYTYDLKMRLDQHVKGRVRSTKNRRPLHLIYYEACLNQQDAINRERYLKTSWGKRYIRNRLKNYLTGWSEASTTEITRSRNAKELPKLKKAAKDGGDVAGKARKDLEKKSGKKVISKQNYLEYPENKKLIEE